MWLAASPAHASTGRLALSPLTGNDQSVITVTTEYACAAGDSIIARIHGHGFPSDGQVVVSNSPITAYPKTTEGGLIIPFAETIRDFVNMQANPVPLAGDYRVVVTCRDQVKLTSLGDFAATLHFSDARSYRADAPGFTPIPKADNANLDAAPDGGAAPGAASPLAGAVSSGQGPQTGSSTTSGDPAGPATSTRATASSSGNTTQLALVFILGALGAAGVFVLASRLTKTRKQAA